MLSDSEVVGRIYFATANDKWFWSLAYGHHENRTPTHGHEATRENAIAQFAKSWRRV